MAYAGLRSLTMRADGALILDTPLGQLIEEAPLIYQQVDGQRREVQGRYTILPSLPLGGAGQPGQVQRVGFRVSGYDPALSLVIDPVLAFSTYLGGSGGDSISGIALDGGGNAYVTGSTGSTDFPTQDAIQPSCGGGTDAFVTQITKEGGIYTYGFSTYLGGTDDDYGLGIGVDAAGNVYVTGETDSSDFPTDKAIQPTYGGGDCDGFVTKIINANGVYTLGYSTYLGGNDYDVSYGVAVDGDGNAYVTGDTESPDFPLRNAIQPAYGGDLGDAFVTQIISASGVYTYAYSSYVGGSDYDWGNAIAVDGDGNTYVTGVTESTDFPTHNAIQPTHGGGSTDAFVTQIITASGVYTYGYSSYLGGKNYDWGNGIALDGYSNAYVTGRTWSSDFPTHGAVQPGRNGWGDAFVTQIISASGVYTYGYSTYLGGSYWDSGNGIAVDGDGNAYVAGDTQSTDFPTHNAIQPTYGGGWELRGDAFATQIISASGVYTYGHSTYLGGTDDDYGRGIAVDGAGNAYVVGRTSSLDFPTRNAIQPTHAGGDKDGFVAIIWEPPYRTYVPLVLRHYSGP
jgi:hypothetical protein